MFVVGIIEFLLYIALIWGALTQIILPIIFGTTLFPVVGRHQLRKALRAEREALERADLAKQLDDLQTLQHTEQDEHDAV